MNDGTDIFADSKRYGGGSLILRSLGGIIYSQLISVKSCKSTRVRENLKRKALFGRLRSRQSLFGVDARLKTPNENSGNLGRK